MPRQAKRQPTSTEYVKRQFVYMGLRWGRTTRKLYIAVMPISDDGMLMRTDPMLFDKKRGYRFVIGGVYEGAEFSEDGVRGLGDAKYRDRWQNESTRIQWAALSDQAEANAESAKLESDAGKRGEIETLLLSLRRTYHGDSMKYDPHKQSALESAVLRALRTPPRSDEKE